MKNDPENLKRQIEEIVSPLSTTSYAYSPLDKSEETKLFENIVRDIIEDIKNNYNPPKFHAHYSNGKLLVEYKGDILDFDKLLEKINLQHLSFSNEEITDYANLVAINHREALSPTQLKNNIEKSDIKQKTSLSKLEYGELLAIRIYSSQDYESMNALLRGVQPKTNINGNPYPLMSPRESILHVAMASHGLEKVPDTELPYVVRCQDTYNLNQLLENVGKHNVTQERAFISTSFTPQEEFGKKVQIICSNVRGKAISAISVIHDENEYLLPPSTQLKWTGYRFKDGIHQFSAEGSNVLLESRQSKLPSYFANREIKKLLNEYESTGKASNSDLKNFLDEVININKKHGLITEEEAREYYKRDNNNLSLQDKDINVIKGTHSVKQKLYGALSNMAKTFGLFSIADSLNDKKEILNLASLKENIDNFVPPINKEGSQAEKPKTPHSSKIGPKDKTSHADKITRKTKTSHASQIEGLEKKSYQEKVVASKNNPSAHKAK